MNKHNAKSRTETPRGNWQRPVILGCFLLSGATALTYEVVWVRMLTLVFGATTLSVGTVLACYMAGLALGSWFWSRRADETAHPLRLYALLEVGIALAALATPFLFGIVQALYRRLFVGGLDDFNALSFARFFLCLPALLLPTFLMGGTLPILARFYTQAMSRIGRGAGDLYAMNTLGAVLGTLLAGFVLVPALGVRGTLHGAVALNLLLAAFAYWLSLRAAPLENISAKPHDAQVAASEAPSPTGAVRTALWGFAISGAAAMIFEVSWTRALVQVFGNSTYAFTTMLACFLIGLALGAALCGRFIDAAPQPIFVFAMLQLAVAAWGAAATPLIEYLPEMFVSAHARWGGSFETQTALQFVVCCLLMLPATLALGAIFPVVTKIFAAQGGGAGRSVGVPYAANTVGTVVGSLLAGFVLLPQLGIEVSVVIGALLNLAVCAALLTREKQSGQNAQMALAVGVLALISCVKLGFSRLDARVMSSGVYMYADYFQRMRTQNKSLRDTVEEKKVLFYRDGYGSSLAVVEVRPPGMEPMLSLIANGKADASTGDLSTQRALAHVPLLLKPDAKRVLVVGLASGCTVGSALLHPVDKVDCVEIEPAMLQAARYFDKWNHACLSDPRVKVHLQDARNFMMMSNGSYDVITSEPTNPWIAGVNNLFTREYYEDCAKRLAPGGAMCQWFPAYNFNRDEMKTALGTFQSVFPYVTVWSFPRIRSDYFAIGSMQPLPFDAPRVAERLRGPILSDMQAVDATNLWEFGGGLLFDSETARTYCQNAVFNTDERPLLEFSTPRHLNDTESWSAAMMAAYGTGQGSRLPVAQNQVPKLLALLKLQPPRGAVLQDATLEARHPAVLRPLEPGETAPDIGVLQLSYAKPRADVSLFPNTPRRPPELQAFWDETPRYTSSKPVKLGDAWRLRRETREAAMLGQSRENSATTLRGFLKDFGGTDNKNGMLQPKASLSDYMGAGR